mmetsp:Transcript_42387/g.83200  ORF Transcript_42387/g.83200 Transcript_42387/m.83200 type:complete len:299 (+) Transcript_42387:51-947(+)|eukprot:CAMPEP_0175138782 /NCGR_PEP_ID=MMETSP0087-20121206/10539_1 /TAXON_ID=136419 /ORGANISM="Unknown Unknown, Strain D1" /LENGTH=298 /DNA_ID=CAMNT_0016421721 /DNA_START=51 /DNA_END=947 /DNA_ORIENTATION=-
MSDSEDSNSSQHKVVVRVSDSDSSESNSSSDDDTPSVPAAPPAPTPTAAPESGDPPAENTETAVAVVNQDELPNLDPALSNIKPIPLKKTLMVVNNFIINTTEFMNKFTVLCEGKLAKVSQKTTNLEIMLALLEVKLGSIDWLGGNSGAAASAEGSAPASEPAAAGAPPPPPGPPGAPGAPPPPPAGGPGAPPAPPPPAPGAPASAEAAAPAAAAFAGPCLKDDPRFAKFFKMRDMGIPVQALIIKMNAEGVDPAVLDMDPLGPPPDGGPPASAAASTAVVIADESDESSEESELDAD